MPVDKGESSVRTIAITVASLLIAALGGMVLTSFQGHASQTDLEKLEAKTEAHESEAQAEWRKQAEFRGHVAAKLRFELKPKETNYAPR